MLFPELGVDTRRLSKILLTTYERAPQDFESLLGIEGVGPRTLRALKRLAEFGRTSASPAGVLESAR